MAVFIVGNQLNAQELLASIPSYATHCCQEAIGRASGKRGIDITQVKKKLQF